MAHGDLDAKPAVDHYASGLYHNGYALLQKGNYDSALPLLVKAADLGNADALKLTGKRWVSYIARHVQRLLAANVFAHYRFAYSPDVRIRIICVVQEKVIC